MSELKALVIDDDRSAQRLLAGLLSDRGFIVETCADGDSALELVQTTNFDLIMLDWLIPGLTGIDLCRQARSLTGGEDPVILVLTESQSKNDLQTALDVGASDYFVKRQGVAELAARIMVAERRVAETNRRKDAEHQLRRNALYDGMTGLPNRALLMDRIDRCTE